MPELINDWEPGKGVVVRWAIKCRRCGAAVKSATSEVAEGWSEDREPNADGRIQGQCPDCRK